MEHVSQWIRWYTPEEHALELKRLAAAASSRTQKLSVLDVFGVSQRVSEAWQKVDLNGFSFDIKLSREHDICSERGFKLLLTKAMEPLDMEIVRCILQIQGPEFSYRMGGLVNQFWFIFFQPEPT